MGSIYNRGTRTKPNWYIAYKDANGRRKTVPSRQPTKALARKYLEQVEARIAAGKIGIEEPTVEPTCGELMNEWAAGLRNRNAQDDRSRLRRHVLPAFEGTRIAAIDLAAVMSWIDRQRAGGKLSDASIRHNLNLLSRFFAWAIERGHTDVNPVRQIPTGRRPRQSPKRQQPWLKDDGMVHRIVEVLPEPIHYMFYLGNRSGLRMGEISGLRMSDFGFVDEGVIRVRYSYDGPLKEDKDESGKLKWAPAADDCKPFLGPWLKDRERAGAQAEDLVFPGPRTPRRPCRKEYIEGHWERLRDQLGLGLTWYQATRHSFVSRLLAAGASLDEVSTAVGHSSPVVTRRYYDHFIRRSYSDRLRAGLGLGK
ncbi:tyrosine-type recombinase/integrase [Haliangium sp.]|uniref:tyrosine-type recombinase/integrase n=1 Tax=Haliangium sp. TaxID=2663208 RepID=UPI003D0F5B83